MFIMQSMINLKSYLKKSDFKRFSLILSLSL